MRSSCFRSGRSCRLTRKPSCCGLPGRCEADGPPHPAESLFLAIRQLLHPLRNDGFVYFQTIGGVTAPQYAESLIAQPTRPKKPV